MSPPIIVGTIELAGDPVKETLVVRIRLEDTTMMDGPSEVIAETILRLEPGTPGPASFRLTVPDNLDEHRQYALSARGRRQSSTDFRDCGTVEAFPWSTGVKAPYHLAMRWFKRD